MGDAVGLDIPAPGGAMRSRRLLRLVGDDRLVAQIRLGSEPAFEVAFERYSAPVLSFCRHMLGSLEEAEDVVQHTFAAAYRDLQRGGDRPIALKPWLFTIARNRCVSVRRARRELPLPETEVASTGLAEQVEQRAELRQLVADVRDLPDDQRAALLLAEVGGLAQAEIASVFDCEVARVKALVYRARSTLVARREARDRPCEVIREQLANLRGGSLRRSELRLHLNECQGCRAFREQVRSQRQMLSAALPVAPTVGLKSSVLAAVGIGGGAAAGGGGAAVAGGATLAKVAALAAVAAGTVAGGAAVVQHQRHMSPAPVVNSGDGARRVIHEHATPATPGVGRFTGSDRPGERRNPAERQARGGQPAAESPARARGRGRGPIEAPPKGTPVRRGPPEPKVRPDKAEKPPKPDKPVREPRVPAGQGQARGRQRSGIAKPEPPGKAKRQPDAR
jgi:RNA polymerase sigma factor (sigma-70 family)